jgi:hypothetical protein
MPIASRIKAALRPRLKVGARRVEELAARVAHQLERPWDAATADRAHGDHSVGASAPSAGLRRPRLGAGGAGGATLVPLDGIDDLLRQAYAIEREGGFGDRVEFLNTTRLDTGPVALPADPASPEYAEAQMALYRAISGVASYDPEVEEVMGVDLEARMRQPAPYDAGSTAAAAGQVMAYGHVLKVLDLRPGDRLLEYGPGQGNLSLMLATIGVRVTAVDISPGYIELIRRRAERDGVEVDAIVGEFGDPPSDGEPVDVILFYEASTIPPSTPGSCGAAASSCDRTAGSSSRASRSSRRRSGRGTGRGACGWTASRSRPSAPTTASSWASRRPTSCACSCATASSSATTRASRRPSARAGRRAPMEASSPSTA